MRLSGAASFAMTANSHSEEVPPEWHPTPPTEVKRDAPPGNERGCVGVPPGEALGENGASNHPPAEGRAAYRNTHSRAPPATPTGVKAHVNAPSPTGEVRAEASPAAASART
jgi:hypothetical protein